MSKENNLSIPEEISSLSGALYISVIKNVVEENWNAEFEAYLHNFKQTLIADFLAENFSFLSTASV